MEGSFCEISLFLKYVLSYAIRILCIYIYNIDQDSDPQRDPLWLVLCNKKPPKSMAPLGVLGDIVVCPCSAVTSAGATVADDPAH